MLSLVCALVVAPSADLPAGMIEPHQWANARIPIHGNGLRGTEIIDRAVEDAMRRHGIVGCGIAVSKGSNVVYAKGFGFSELPSTLFRFDTTSRCGSVAKPIAGLAALVLVDQGKLRLDETVVPILKSVGIEPRPRADRKIDERVNRITVRDLLNHTSGLVSGTPYTAWRAGCDVAKELGLTHAPTAKDVASFALESPQFASEPGKAFAYSNANFVLLGRVIEAKSGMSYADFLAKVAMPRFGIGAQEIHVSRNQTGPSDPARGLKEAAYYQTAPERFVSFDPKERTKGRVFAEAYHGFATEATDAAGGTAASAYALAKVLAKLNSRNPGLSQRTLKLLLSPPDYVRQVAKFDYNSKDFYSTGFNVRLINPPMFSHGGMTLHAGGAIGHNAGYQFVIVSNWNNAQGPFVDAILSGALGAAMPHIRLTE